MFQTISWQTYWTTIMILSIGYYLFIYLLYFRKGLMNGFQNLSAETPITATTKSFSDNKTDSENIDNEERPAQSCLDEINAFFEAKKKSKTVKSELLYGLHALVQKYPSLKASSYRNTLSNIMVTQAENICSVHLSADEVKSVWLE